MYTKVIVPFRKPIISQMIPNVRLRLPNGPAVVNRSSLTPSKPYVLYW